MGFAGPLLINCSVRMKVLATLVFLAALAAGVHGTAFASQGPPERPDTRQVMFVGNNWAGTADIIDARTFARLGRIDTIPDRAERLREIVADPAKLGFYLAIRELVGEGNDQYTDDMFTTHDGRLVAVSRPSFADVVGIDLATGEILWRFPMEGFRADHMAVSPDGTSLLVSDSTANKVHELDLRTGRKTGEFPSGDSPHENTYSRDGRLVYHASIGRVYTPTDRSELGFARDTTKGERYFQVVDADSLAILERWDIGEKLDEAGYPDMSSAVRPMALAPDERFAYLQVSFHHGFVEYDLQDERVTRVAHLPLSEASRDVPREQYLLDSAHHGLAMNAAGTKLCAAGTVSDYAAIVSRESLDFTIPSRGSKPYWSTNGPGGDRCWVSYSGDDEVAVIDYATEREVARMPVGDHPQRIRSAVVAKGLLSRLPGGPEPFALGLFHKTSPTGIGIWRERINVGCRAEGAEAIRLAGCEVRLRAAVRGEDAPTTLGEGRAAPADRRAVKVRVELSAEGRALLDRRPEGFRATIVATGRDSLGRERTVRERVTFRRGTRPRAG